MKKLFTLLILISTIFADIQIINKGLGKNYPGKIIKNRNLIYISLKDFSKAASFKLYENQERKKLVIYMRDKRIKITGQSSYIVIDDDSYQMVNSVISVDEDLYVPLVEFIAVLKSNAMPGLDYNPIKELLIIDILTFTVNSLKIEEKSNGTIIKIKTKKQFPERNISSFINKHGWYYLTIVGANIDTNTISNSILRGVVRKIESDQIGPTAQISLKLRSKVISHEWYQNPSSNEIIITLRTPLNKSEKRIQNVKKRWRLNTVVLDAGHGGKDPGTIGKYGTKEKDIVLDITKRIGKLLSKKGIDVIYTRTEDEFIPLWKRTKIANEAGGKIFVSIHINANPNRKVKGFETYLLQSGKSQDAIEVASRENSAIKLEEIGDQYKDLNNENLIMATMAQSMFLRESEDLASLIQIELDKKLESPNRGVKQAGFYVLVGASMPCVLVEGGFVSNLEEEKNLKKSSYRQKIAESIYSGISQFKLSHEKLMAE